jgi:hypothetical protein
MAVTTALNSGTLTITGDSAADDIAIVGTANPGEITVTGRNGTTINGTPNGSVTIPGVTADLVLALDDGDNVVDMDNVYIARDIRVTTGVGSDNITLGAASPVSPANDLIVSTGSGQDSIRLGVTIYNVYVAADCVIAAGDGNDVVSAYGASSLAQFSVTGDGGADSLLLVGVTAGGQMTVTGNDGDNSLAVLTSSAFSLYVTSFFDADTIYVDTVFTRDDMRIGRTAAPGGDQTGQDDLTITVASSIFRRLDVYGGGGDDTIYLSGNVGTTPEGFGFSIGVGAGQGRDNIQLSYHSLASPLLIDAGSEDDDVSLVGNRVAGSSSANGGTGFNRLTLLGNQFSGFSAINFQ